MSRIQERKKIEPVSGKIIETHCNEESANQWEIIVTQNESAKGAMVEELVQIGLPNRIAKRMLKVESNTPTDLKRRKR